MSEEVAAAEHPGKLHFLWVARAEYEDAHRKVDSILTGLSARKREPDDWNNHMDHLLGLHGIPVKKSQVPALRAELRRSGSNDVVIGLRRRPDNFKLKGMV